MEKNLISIFNEHDGKVSDKWSIYLNVYNELLSRYKKNEINLFEIGIQNGGSLEIWGKYFENAKLFVGCDIDQNCAQLEFKDERIKVLVGDANSADVVARVNSIASDFQIIIDDGSHTSRDIILSFLNYFEKLSDEGLYIIEDLHCSYWKEFDGGVFDLCSSMSFLKKIADAINAEHWGVNYSSEEIFKNFEQKYQLKVNKEIFLNIHSIEFFNSICVIRKKKAEDNFLGKRVFAGKLHVLTAEEVVNVVDLIHTPSQYSNILSDISSEPDKKIKNLILELDNEIKDKVVFEKLIDELRAEMLSLNGQVDLMRNSLSWRLTKPLRQLKNYFK